MNEEALMDYRASSWPTSIKCCSDNLLSTIVLFSINLLIIFNIKSSIGPDDGNRVVTNNESVIFRDIASDTSGSYEYKSSIVNIPPLVCT